MNRSEISALEQQASELSLLTRREVAEVLKVSTRTIQRMELRGRITPVYLSSKAVRYRRSDIIELIRSSMGSIK